MSQFIEDTEVGKMRTFLVKFREFGKSEAKSEFFRAKNRKALIRLVHEFFGEKRNTTNILNIRQL